MKKTDGITGLRVFVSETQAPDTISLITPIPWKNETKDHWLRRCVMVHNIQMTEQATEGAD